MRVRERARVALPVVAVLASLSGSAVEQIYRDEPSLGIAALPAERNRWRACCVHPATEPRDADIRFAGPEFFADEYNGFKPFAFDAGPTGAFTRVYGARAFDDAATGACVGRGWGPFAENHARLEIEIEQNAGETTWEIATHRREWREPRTFVLKGGCNVFDLGVIGKRFFGACGLEFTCRTKGAKGRVTAIRFGPAELRMGWRNRFSLAEKPVKAGISYIERPDYTLTVNGRRVTEGSRILFTRVRRVDLTPHLKAGANEIAFEGNWGGGYDGGKTLSAEAFTVDAEGRTERLADADWESRVRDGAWTRCRVGGRIGFESLPNRTVVAEGSLPLHAGPLMVRPRNPDGSIYPVFDCDGPITWFATVPAGVAGEIVATVGGREYAVTNGVVDFAGLGTGPHEIVWTLRRDGKTVDTDRTEMIVAGPLPGLRTVPYHAFERTYRDARRLVQTVDCTRAEGNPTNFVDHTGPYATPAVNAGRVTTEGGLRFRETGAGDGDFFGYRLAIGARGHPHVVEVDVPDVREQVLYVSINESFPIPFCNNGFPLGSRGWPNATGAARSGGAQPLSGTTKTLSVVFFPATENITITFENGLAGRRAGVAAFRVYEVPGGLPALEIPETERLFANHNERLVFQSWGAHVNPRLLEYARDSFDGCWRAAYAAIANRIAFLKFAGHNASVEGAYMYSEGFPTASGESESRAEDWDAYYALAKMYRHNRIRLLTCCEYMMSPRLFLSGDADVSDAEIRAGTRRGIHSVDRHGRQVCLYMGGGLNFLNPQVEASVKRVVDEVYRRYAPTRAVEALWIVNGYWWMPGIPMLQRGTARDVGYDDDSIERFQRETGIDLGLPWKGVARFPARHRLLNGKYSDEWYGWRARRLRKALEDIHAVVGKGAEKWRLYAVPTGVYPEGQPFVRFGATAAERDAFLGDVLKGNGFDPALYGRGTDGDVTLVPAAAYARALEPDFDGVLANRGSRALYRRNDALYFQPVGLNERNTRCPAAKAWWWNSNGVAVYDVKPIGVNAFADLVDAITDYTPRNLFHTWIDVNVPSAFAEESRRFLVGFYATPVGEPVRFEGIRGVTANRYGAAVQLLNATPYPLKGRLRAGGEAVDALTGRRFSGELDYELAPFGVTAITLANPARGLTGSFDVPPAVHAAARDRVCMLLSRRRFCARVGERRVKELEAAVTSDDGYALVHLLRDGEVARAAERMTDAGTIRAKDAPAPKTLVAWRGMNAVEIACGGAHRIAGTGRTVSCATTLSLLVKAEGTRGTLMAGFEGIRFDLSAENGRMRPAIVGFPPGKEWFAAEMPPFDGFPGGWHHVVYRVDPVGEGSVWVDGEKVVSRDFGMKFDRPLPPRKDGGLSFDLWDNGRVSADCRFTIRRVELREGLMTAAEIDAEADAWIAGARP